MEFQTITEVSRKYGISARMLRYYEKNGLISSLRKDDYAYRIYDEEAIHNLKCIIFLRKLRIPVKQIKEIIESPNAVDVVEIFEKNISELDEEITALSTVRAILQQFLEELQNKADIHLQFDLCNSKTMLAVLDSISLTKNNLKRELSMDDLNMANEKLMKTKEKYIRLVYLPPMTVAEVNFYGLSVMPGEDIYLPEVEETDYSVNGKQIPAHFHAGLNAIDKLIKDSNLAEMKPDFRLFCFAACAETFSNSPEVMAFGPFYGFGRWLTIPDAMEVPFPFVKKHIDGGLYCAYSRPLPMSEEESDEWDVLNHWIVTNGQYEYDAGREPACNYGLLEEYLNYMHVYQASGKERPPVQTDLLMPIREK